MSDDLKIDKKYVKHMRKQAGHLVTLAENIKVAMDSDDDFQLMMTINRLLAIKHALDFIDETKTMFIQAGIHIAREDIYNKSWLEATAHPIYEGGDDDNDCDDDCSNKDKSDGPDLGSLIESLARLAGHYKK